MGAERTPWRHIAKEAVRRLRRTVAGRPAWSWHFVTAPDNLVAPIADLRIADITTAEQIYSGIFSLGGKVLHSGGQNIFGLPPPGRRFFSELHDFRWLRHLSADGTQLAASRARALLTDWMAADDEAPFGPAWSDDIAARRLIAFLQHGALPLNGADPAFRKRFLKRLGLHVRHLSRNLPTAADGMTRLRMRIALTAARIALPSSGAGFHDALRKLSAEVRRHVHADGGPMTRNPEDLLDLLCDIVPIRLAAIAEGQHMPDALDGMIDRMFAALAFFRHSDGELALFNGCGAVIPDAINAVFRHDSAHAPTPARMAESGFDRLAARGTTVICDTGGVPGFAHSRNIHAGTLAFELSSGRHRYIVNAGVDHLGPDAYRQISRQTVAHSTLGLNETSSTRFAGSRRVVDWLGRGVPAGPSTVEAAATGDDIDGPGVRASHDGYVAAFGLVHVRDLALSPDGTVLNGVDRILTPDGAEPGERAAGVSAAIRFHLHPLIHVIRDGQGRLMLMADADDSWTLQTDGPEPELSDSFFFAKVGGATRTRVITITFDPATQATVRWRWIKTGTGTRL